MINVILRGGLGNNLFQYAVGKHLAVKNNTTLRLNIKNYINRHDLFGRKVRKKLSHFSIKPILYYTMLHELVIRRLGIHRPSSNDNVYQEKVWGFVPEVLSLGDGITLRGYYQSEKYFKDIEEIIRNDLRISNNSFGKESDFYKEQISELNSVGLHIRRGDYLKKKYHNVCNINYYSNSVEYMQEKLESPHFFVFSDDMEWCIENLQLSDCSFVEIKASRKNPVIDLQLMSLCKHNIISNSSFSWWGAWLNENKEKIVVVPNRWHKLEEINTNAMKSTVPEDWIRIDF